ncbi:hypothetical protein A2477_03730 [Candidatus Falkowbacteria bacterium RIFOXYC2_FULL_47_12]|uniref:AFP-like domain-containing protein n=2 Tax=Candidatus Falkowiibacteriota TaxID=1752728 RepID=A0A1F5TNY4_9BACT|nr:MAG: hypothetical protein A2242_03745 [Candidatus Falkowbacteria bacterium RIFOXYA2_FULL_47_9]OGF40663.1 MAG: hypothetical protein A2477_03730 [Candidatus Falkowbacteria bacterium RIFOXYC2_FULL_47_12]
MLPSKQKVFIVAEIGKSFIQTEAEQSVDEYLDNARALVRAAYEAGADAVKFQTHRVDDEQLNVSAISPHFSHVQRYAWVKRNSEATPLRFWQEIKNYADELGILFFSTPMSRGAAQLLEKVGMPVWKVASSDILDFVLLDYIAATGKPIIISTGMSTPEELDMAMDFLKQRTNDIILLHCVSKYPCPPNELYLDTIPYLAKKYAVPVGFSDHSIGIESSIAAVGKGACIIERHFSFSRDLWGSDHKVSMTPPELKQMGVAIRRRDYIDPSQFGAGVKVLDENESALRPVFRKSLVAGQDIKAGDKLTKEMLYAMRPQLNYLALPSQSYIDILGKIALKDLKKFEPITNEILQ